MNEVKYKLIDNNSVETFDDEESFYKKHGTYRIIQNGLKQYIVQELVFVLSNDMGYFPIDLVHFRSSDVLDGDSYFKYQDIVFPTFSNLSYDLKDAERKLKDYALYMSTKDEREALSKQVIAQKNYSFDIDNGLKELV